MYSTSSFEIHGCSEGEFLTTSSHIRDQRTPLIPDEGNQSHFTLSLHPTSFRDERLAPEVSPILNES